MYKIESRICCARLGKEAHCVIHSAGDQVCRPYRPVVAGYIWVVRVEPDGSFDLRDRELRFTQAHQRHTKLLESASIVAVESDRSFELDLGVGQPVLNSAEHPHRKMRHRVAHFALERFAEHLVRSRLIPLEIVAESEDQIIN